MGTIAGRPHDCRTLVMAERDHSSIFSGKANIALQRTGLALFCIEYMMELSLGREYYSSEHRKLKSHFSALVSNLKSPKFASSGKWVKTWGMDNGASILAVIHRNKLKQWAILLLQFVMLHRVFSQSVGQRQWCFVFVITDVDSGQVHYCYDSWTLIQFGRMSVRSGPESCCDGQTNYISNLFLKRLLGISLFHKGLKLC